MPDTYDHITLMCRLKAAQRRNKELESGERYIQLEELHQKEYNVYEHKIEKLKKELADAHKETIRVRNYWFQVLEDMLREFEKAQKRSAQELRKMEIRALNAEKQRDDALDKAAVFRHQFYEAASRLEEEQGISVRPDGWKTEYFQRHEFALKTEPERRSAYADMLLSPVMHTDCTNARENGKSCQAYVCATPDGKALYFAREKKGHEGVKGTVAEDYQGILVHDHDITFYNYGADHQECLAHVLRYLKASIENEPNRTWNKKMHALVQEMVHFRNGCRQPHGPDPEIVSGFEKRYREILETARKEYENIPANDYYKDGYNLFLRMEKYMHNHLLFLHDIRVPATNNEAERLLRNYKRKQAQAVTFRSFESIDYLCQCMSMLVLMRLEEPENIFDRVSRIFG